MAYITIAEAAKLLASNDNLLFVCHTRPDGDTVGSAMALTLGLRAQGKRAYCVCDDRIPKRLQFLTEGADSISLETLPADFTPEFICAVDVASANLLGSYEERFADSFDLRIDHHERGDLDAEDILLCGEASAAGELAAQILFELGIADIPAYTCAYAAIASDSGSFKYSSVRPITHDIASKMLSLGVNHTAVNDRLFGSRPLSQARAYGAAVNALRFVAPGVAVIAFSREMLISGGFSDEDIDDLASIPKGIEGVELGITVKPMKSEDTKFKISMRSSETIDCSALCALFEGGGHKRASGGSIEASTIKEAEEKVVAVVLDALSRGIGVENE